MRVDLILADPSHHGLEMYIAAHITKAFEKLEIETKLVSARTMHYGPYLHSLMSSLPDGLISFSPHAPALCSLCAKPHLFWHAGWLSKVCEHEKCCNFLDHLYFLAPAASKVTCDNTMRSLDVVMVDALTDPLEPFLEELIEICTQRRRVDMWADHRGANWLKRFKNGANLYLHAALPYRETLRMFCHAKILLRATPIIDFGITDCGADPWFFAAIMQGALVLISPTPYLQSIFGIDAPCFFPREDAKAAAEKIDYFLEHPSEREVVVKQMQQVIADAHTYEHRAREIIDLLRNY